MKEQQKEKTELVSDRDTEQGHRSYERPRVVSGLAFERIAMCSPADIDEISECLCF